MAAWLAGQGVQLVVCAGYMHLLRPNFSSASPAGSSTRTRRRCRTFPARTRSRTCSPRARRRPRRPCTTSTRASTPGRDPRRAGSGARGRHGRDAARARAGRRAPAAAEGRPGADLVIQRALLSTFDKTGLAEFARARRPRRRARGERRDRRPPGRARARRQARRGADRDPRACSADASRRCTRASTPRSSPAATPDDLAALDEHGIQPFDLVCVNLYPFTQVVSRHGCKEEDAVEMIDIGGPSMLRAAAKNFAHVAPVCRPERYGSILAELRESGEIALETRRALATEAFSVTAAYEAAIARWFSDRDAFPELLIPSFEKVTDLVYGENPHQRAAYYAEAGARRHLLSRVGQLHGRELSFNNLNDLSAGRMLLREFTLPACVIVKHANPCGVAVAGSIEEAYERALAADPLSAYGGVVVLNRPVRHELGAKISEQFIEVLLRTGYAKKGARSPQAEAGDADPRRPRAAPLRPGRKGLQARARRPARPGPRLGRRGPRGDGGRLRRPVGGRLGRPALRLAGLQARDLERDRAREGAFRPSGSARARRAASTQSRSRSTRRASTGHDLTGSALASDAFFPFRTSRG